MAARKPKDLIPNDPATEILLLTAMAYSEQACEVAISGNALSPDHFHHPGRRLVFAAIFDLYFEGESTDPTAIAARLEETDEIEAVGGRAGVAEATGGDFMGLDLKRLPTHVARLKRLAAMKVGLTESLALRDEASAAGDPEALAEHFRNAAEEIEAQLSMSDSTDEYTIDGLLALADEGYDWVVEGCLERSDVFMLTAGGGVGKSLFMLQFALQAATGRHPFSPGRPITPVKAFYVQVENSPNEEGRRVRSMIATAELHGLNRDNFVAWMPKDGVNLATAKGMAQLRSKIVRHRPDIVVLSPWKDFHDGFASQGDGGEGAFVKIKRQLDTMLRKYRFALLIEAHASGAQSGSIDPEHYRPRGTVAQSNWATYGYCLIPKRSDDGKTTIPGRYIFGQWRGPRDRQRKFPKGMREGSMWPWMPDDDDPAFRGPIADQWEDRWENR